MLPVAALVATLTASPAAAELRWTSVHVDAHLAAVGTLELTEKHVLAVSNGSFVATRRLDVRRPAEVDLVEVVLLDPGGEERELARGTLGEENRYDFDLVSSTLSWTLRPTDASGWEKSTMLAYRIRWRVRGALTPVWGARPVPRLMPNSSLRERIAARWRETSEALRRAGPNPARRYVLDVNLAAPGREGPIEALDYVLTSDDSWVSAGKLMSVSLDRAFPADEGADLSFLFDRKDQTFPAGVGFVWPVVDVAIALLPFVFAAAWLVENRRAWAAKRSGNGTGTDDELPPGPEALSPELFGALFGEDRPAAPRTDEVWGRLRDGKSVVVDRQAPPNLVLGVEPADLRPPEAALAGALFGERRAVPLVAIREEASWLDNRPRELVRSAFDQEVRRWLGEVDQTAEAPLFPSGKGHKLERIVFILALLALLGTGVPLAGKAVAVVTAFSVAVGLLFAVRRLRDAGFALGGGLVPVVGSLPLAAVLLAATYLDPSRTDLVVLALPATLVVLRAGFLGARPRPGRDLSPLRRWASEQRDGLRERLLRGGGEVEPGEAPWFRAAGLEVSLSQPGVSRGDLEEILGVSSGEDG